MEPAFEAPFLHEQAHVIAESRDLTGSGEEDAAFVAFLAGDESGFFVGQAFPFAGGWVT